MPVKNYNDLQFEAIIAYVDSHYTNPNLSVDLLCERFDTSPYIIGCCFKDFTGKTFLEYVIDLRMRRAAVLLADSDAEICTIASAVGYAYPSYFARTFRARFGMTPSAYRSRHRVAADCT